MAAFMKGYESQSYALLRIVTGFVFLWHGSQKLFPLFPPEYGGNGGELAALYCFVFLFFSARGPGIWSVDGSRGEAAAAA
jgi:putative oxidoreductase